jgi:hypothetical protein
MELFDTVVELFGDVVQDRGDVAGLDAAGELDTGNVEVGVDMDVRLYRGRGPAVL